MPYTFNPFTGTFDDTVPLENGQISSDLLPSYVDDVLEYADFASFPVTGETGKIYVAIDAGTTYRWSGSAYIAIGGTVNNIDDLADVDTSTVAPADGQSLIWDSSTLHWKPGTITSGATELNDLSDVDTATTAPTDGQVLTWDDTAGTWEPGDIAAGAAALNDLSDVDTSATLQVGYPLVWNGVAWVPSTTKLASSNLDGIDADYNSTVLQLNFDHPAGTTPANIIDDSPLNNTIAGTGYSPIGSIIDTNPKAGSGCLYEKIKINSPPSSLNMPADGTALTLEFWMRDWASTSNFYAVYFTSTVSSLSGGIRINGTSGAVSWFKYNSVVMTHQNTITKGSWNHIALTRQSGSAAWRLHVNGVASAVETTSYSMYCQTSLEIGGYGTVIDLYRQTYGVARYNGTTFTPPSTAYVKGDGYTASSINTFDDVDTSTTVPTTDQGLTWNGSKWVPTNIITTTSLKTVTAASTDFADFQSRIAAL